MCTYIVDPMLNAIKEFINPGNFEETLKAFEYDKRRTEFCFWNVTTPTDKEWIRPVRTLWPGQVREGLGHQGE